jgi:hypothetical protein
VLNLNFEQKTADGQKYFQGFFFKGRNCFSFLNFIKVKALLKIHMNQFFGIFKKFKNRLVLKKSFKIVINQLV